MGNEWLSCLNSLTHLSKGFRHEQINEEIDGAVENQSQIRDESQIVRVWVTFGREEFAAKAFDVFAIVVGFFD